VKHCGLERQANCQFLSFPNLDCASAFVAAKGFDLSDSRGALAEDLIIHMHGRVDGYFLPLSVRQNRVEDIFLDFLGWLTPTTKNKAGESDQYRGAEGKTRYIFEHIDSNEDAFKVTADASKRKLIRDWIRSELIVDPRATNRTTTDAVSVLPLHLSIADHFEVPGQPPAYGRLISELLATNSDGYDFALLDSLVDLFADAGSDPVAKILQEALGSQSEGIPRYKSLASGAQRMVCERSHARRFQDQVSTVLRFRERISRRGIVTWLYAVLTFFLSTYFIRMAKAAAAYEQWLADTFAGAPLPWEKSLSDNAFSPAIPYGHRNESHASLMKRFPGSCSQAILARRFAELSGYSSGKTLPEISRDILQAVGASDASSIFEELAHLYPTSESRIKGSWRLDKETKERLIGLAEATDIHPFVLTARLLNFEDMARSSNNVMEWQFYSSLSRHQTYGFARQGRSGDVLIYEMTPGLLSALTHCHAAQHGQGATLSTLITYFESLGFEFDGIGRQLLESQLEGLGLLEGLSDASDAKYLSPLYEPAVPK
jgi:hypothetical protein